MGKSQKLKGLKEKERSQKKKLFDETNFIHLRLYNLIDDLEEQKLISPLEGSRLSRLCIYSIRILQDRIHENRSRKGIKKNKLIKIFKVVKEFFVFLWFVISVIRM